MRKSDVARAAAYIGKCHARLRIKPVHHRIFPQAMDEPRHEVIHQIIFRRHTVKDIAHQPRLVGGWHLAEPEGDGLVFGGHGLF